MVLTTGGPPAAGMFWQALVLRQLTLGVAPRIGVGFDPKANLHLSLTPGIGMRPPQRLRLQLRPFIGMPGGTTESADLHLGLTPRVHVGSIQGASFGLSLACEIDMAGIPRDLESGALEFNMTPRVKATAVGHSVAVFNAAGAGTAPAGATLTSGSYSDSIPSDTNCTLIWITTNATGVPTVTVGSKTAVLNTTAVCGGGVFIHCFQVLTLPGGTHPTGTQTVAVTMTAGELAMEAVHYKNVATIGTATKSESQTGATVSMSAASTLTYGVYANGFSYLPGAAGQTFTGYNQTQRFLKAGVASGPRPTLVGDAPGNGSTLTFSATRTNTGTWGGIIVPLLG